MKDLLIIFLSAMAAAMIVSSCIRQDMRSAHYGQPAPVNAFTK
ncbi:MAG TPA: hypothetical protein PKZ32_07370 [Candidatus Melainabacteria bacterium]|nr:hypothetical protein [Candidatus Melainabacteria bacterium]